MIPQHHDPNAATQPAPTNAPFVAAPLRNTAEMFEGLIADTLATRDAVLNLGVLAQAVTAQHLDYLDRLDQLMVEIRAAVTTPPVAPLPTITMELPIAPPPRPRSPAPLQPPEPAPHAWGAPDWSSEPPPLSYSIPPLPPPTPPQPVRPPPTLPDIRRSTLSSESMSAVGGGGGFTTRSSTNVGIDELRAWLRAEKADAIEWAQTNGWRIEVEEYGDKDMWNVRTFSDGWVSVNTLTYHQWSPDELTVGMPVPSDTTFIIMHRTGSIPQRT